MPYEDKIIFLRSWDLRAGRGSNRRRQKANKGVPSEAVKVSVYLKRSLIFRFLEMAFLLLQSSYRASIWPGRFGSSPEDERHPISR